MKSTVFKRSRTFSALMLLVAMLLSTTLAGLPTSMARAAGAPLGRVDALKSRVSLYITHGQISDPVLGNNLMAKLNATRTALVQGKKQLALIKMWAFVRQVRSERGKKIVTVAADMLIAKAKALINAIKAMTTPTPTRTPTRTA